MTKTLLFLLAAFLPLIANAEEISVSSSLTSGFWHPITRYEHCLAMLCVGIISSQINIRNIFAIPATFISMMLVGIILVSLQIHIPYSEYIISLSVFALGLSITLLKRLPQPLVIVFIGFFGVFHGYALSVEMPGIFRTIPYSLGFLISAAVITGAGIVLCKFVRTFSKGHTLLKYCGAVIAGMGLQLMLIMHTL